jgi:hypothetical protein
LPVAHNDGLVELPILYLFLLVLPHLGGQLLYLLPEHAPLPGVFFLLAGQLPSQLLYLFLQLEHLLLLIVHNGIILNHITTRPIAASFAIIRPPARSPPAPAAPPTRCLRGQWRSGHPQTLLSAIGPAFRLSSCRGAPTQTCCCS